MMVNKTVLDTLSRGKETPTPNMALNPLFGGPAMQTAPGTGFSNATSNQMVQPSYPAVANQIAPNRGSSLQFAVDTYCLCDLQYVPALPATFMASPGVASLGI